MNIVEKSKERYLEYEKRHQDILDAAIRIFNTKGYQASTTAEIAHEAGISEPTMYKHFSGKKDLFLKCVRAIQDELLDEYRRIYEEYRNHKDEILYMDGVSKVYFDFVRDKTHKSMFLVHLLSYKDDPDFERELKNFIENSVTGIERILTSARKKGRIKSPLDAYSLACFYVNQYFTVVALREFMDPNRFKEEMVIRFVHSLLGVGASE
jgi:AcrR family transcriptional regulator